ncbi:hypothetical protein K2Z84_14305 [Candidatus Binatia bacterium]|nr:hypothetical protein [Candidatus Binatia bacterium]
MSRLTKRATVVGVATLLTAALAGAQDAPSDRLPGNDATLRDTPAVNSALPPPLPASKGSTEGDLGEHQVTGTVRELDASNGTLVVDVKGKELRVLFPGSALARLERGDQVTVTVAVHKTPTAATR